MFLAVVVKICYVFLCDAPYVYTRIKIASRGGHSALCRVLCVEVLRHEI